MTETVSKSTRRRLLNGAVLYIVDDEGILFAPTLRRLFRLNASATFIWCRYEEGLKPRSIAQALAERFGIAEEVALQDTLRTLSERNAGGLVNAQADDLEHKPSASDSVDIAETASDPKRPEPRCEPYSEHAYRVSDLQFLIRYPCEETAQFVHGVFAHLEQDDKDNHQGPSVSFEIVGTVRGYALFQEAKLIADRCAIAELAPIIQREALLATYQSTECLVAVHAAAVSKGRHCVLMPAAKGSGKSTLTAGLLASGYTYLTDECSLLMRKPSQIRPMPLSLGLKRGSWPTLHSLHPVLNGLPIHVQSGGVDVRFLNPPKDLIATEERYSVTHIVFPKYAAGTPTGLTPVGHAEALYRIAAGGYAVPGQLNVNRVEGLIEWLTRLPCYELVIGKLEDAIGELEIMLR